MFWVYFLISFYVSPSFFFKVLRINHRTARQAFYWAQPSICTFLIAIFFVVMKLRWTPWSYKNPIRTHISLITFPRKQCDIINSGVVMTVLVVFWLYLDQLKLKPGHSCEGFSWSGCCRKTAPKYGQYSLVAAQTEGHGRRELLLACLPSPSGKFIYPVATAALLHRLLKETSSGFQRSLKSSSSAGSSRAPAPDWGCWGPALHTITTIRFSSSSVRQSLLTSTDCIQ